MFPDLHSPAAEPGGADANADADPDPDRDRDPPNTCFSPSSAAEPGPSTSKSAADPYADFVLDAAVDLDRGTSNPSLLILPKALLIRGMQSGPPSSAANPILTTRKRAAVREADADADLDRKSRTEIEADLMYSGVTQTPPRSKRTRICMAGEEEEKATGSWGRAASGKRVVRPSSSADVCEPTPKRRKVTSGKPTVDRKMEIPDGEGSHFCWRSTTSFSDLTDAENGYDDYLDADKSRDNLMESHADDTSFKEQVFVRAGSSLISMQKQLNQTSVEMLIKSAFERARVNTNDFYCTYSGKCLDKEKLLSYYPVERNSTIRVQHRLRGGARDQTFACSTWNEKIQLVPLPHFNLVLLLPWLRDMTRNITSANFLCRDIQELASEVFVALCGMHLRGGSLDGQFDQSHVLFDGKKAHFYDQLVVLEFTPERARNDFAVIFNLFNPVFFDGARQDYATHANHLLNFISNIPPHVNLQSPLVIAFLINHCALQNYAERISTCTMLGCMLNKLIWEEMQYFMHHIGPLPDWNPIEDVAALNAIRLFNSYWDPALQRRILTYFEHGASCNHLAFNFFKHGPKLPLHLLDACFSAVMANQNFMPNLLEHIATFDQLLPDPPFDVVKIIWSRSWVKAEKNRQVKEYETSLKKRSHKKSHL